MEKKKFDYRLLINNLFFTLPLIIVLIKLYETNKFNIRNEIGIPLFLFVIIILTLLILTGCNTVANDGDNNQHDSCE